MSLSNIEIREWLKEYRHSHSPWGEKTDSNGYVRSIMGADEECYICHDPSIARHEIFFGSPNRKTSKACGFWVGLCPKHHEFYHNKAAQNALKKACQEVFEKSHTREEFRALIGRSYL